MDIITGGLPEQPTKDAAINLANHLLGEFNIPTKVVDIQDISSSLFVVLYESLFSDRLPGIIRQPTSKDDEIHNCQIVIDVLSTDVIHDSLSHIHGVDVVSGDLTAIFNLLDIFSHLLEYVMNKIESDQDDTRSAGGIEPCSERIPLPKRNEIGSFKRNLQGKEAKVTTSRNKGVKLVAYGSQQAASLNKNENRKAYDDHKIISHEDYYAMAYGGLSKHHDVRPLSPIHHDHSQSLLGQKTVDSECDTDTEKMLDSLSGHHRIAWDDKPASVRDAQSVAAGAVAAGAVVADAAVAGAAVAATSYLDKEKPHTTTTTATALSSSMPPSQTQAPERHDPLRSTIGPVTYHTHPTPESAHTERAPDAERMPSYYRDLRQLVKKTAAMTRIALETSPARIRAENNWETSHIDEQRPSLSGEDVRLAQELNAMRTEQYNLGKKRVAFAASQSEATDGQSGLPGSKYYTDQLIGDDSDQYINGVDQEQGLRRRYRLDPTDILSAGQTHKKPISAGSESQTKAFAQHLARNRQSELGEAHLALKNEDLKIRKKHELLRTFYEKDHEEFSENVEYMLGRDHEKAAETEGRYVQACAQAALKKKGELKVKGTSAQPMRKKSWKKAARRQISNRESKKSPIAPVIESEEDVLPYLLDEFPSLHLSEHTWHELWRKGLHQIEGLTRAYQEIGRKKSQAQNQLSDAAERHNLLSEIMKKQLDHSRRQQEIKEQKQHQIEMKNKTHEKRIQSARARRYYNEYQVRARAKVLKKRTKEEMVFRDLFKDTLNIQRERIKDIRRYASDQRKRQELQRQNEIDSLENFYHNQFEMLAERLARERFETEVQDVAQKQMMGRMKKELRKKMESEIKQYQEQIFRCDDDAHFRQADADRVKQYLHLARYSVKI